MSAVPAFRSRRQEDQDSEAKPGYIVNFSLALILADSVSKHTNQTKTNTKKAKIKATGGVSLTGDLRNGGCGTIQWDLVEKVVKWKSSITNLAGEKIF